VTRIRRREVAQSDILSAAATFIAHNGYHGTSMRDLAKATGRGLSSLYTYFPSKEALLYALQTRAFESLIESAEGAASQGEPAEQRLYAFILNHIRYFLAHPDVMRVLVQEARVLPARYRRRIRVHKERYYVLAEGMLAELADGRGPRRAASRLTPEELEKMTYGFFGVVNWVWAWYEPKRHGKPHDVARTLHALVVRGATGHLPDESVWHAVEQDLERHRVESPLAVPSPS
jgi:AcrR family transcriptional regulator